MTRNRKNAAAGKKRISRLLAVMLALVLCLSVMPTSAAADGETTSTSLTYLALGDSITAGYGLDDASTEVFVTLLADEIGATTPVNSGVSGLTAAQLYAALSAGNVTYNAAIMAADVITITIGGNDLMAAFYQIVADTYNSTSSLVKITAENVQEIFTNGSCTIEVYGQQITVQASALISQLQNIESTALASNDTFTDAVSTCVTNINYIAAYIKSINDDAIILVANQYNPYLWISSYLVGTAYADSFDNIIELFGTAVSAYNTALSYYGSADYTVVDVYSAFVDSYSTDPSYAGKLTNAEVTYTIDTSTYQPVLSYDFDFHPNVAGHKLIASLFADELAATLTFEVGDDSSEITVSDGNGDEVGSSLATYKGTTIDLSQYTASRSGYVFGGWYSDEALSESVTSVKVYSDMTVYAAWTEEAEDTEEPSETETADGTEEETAGTEEETAGTEEESTDTETESEESTGSTLTGTSEDGSMYYAITVDSADSSSYIIVEVSDESGSYIYAGSNGTCYYVSASGETTDITDYTGELISLSEGETYSVTVDYDGSDVVISFYNEDGEVVLSYTIADTDMDDEITTTLSASDDAVITIDEASVETANETNSEEETDSEDSTDTEDDTNSEDETDTEEDTDSEDSTDSEDTESAAGSDDTESGDASGSSTTGGSSSTASGTSSSPKTGDASPIIPIAVAIFGCAAVVFASKKRMA